MGLPLAEPSPYGVLSARIGEKVLSISTGRGESQLTTVGDSAPSFSAGFFVG